MIREIDDLLDQVDPPDQSPRVAVALLIALAILFVSASWNG